MGRKALWVIIIIVGVALGATVLLFFPRPTEPHTALCTTEAKMCPDGTSVGRTGPQCEFAECPAPRLVWNFVHKDTDPVSGTPHTEVFLSMNDKEYSAGVYDGTCTNITDSSWQLIAGEKTGAICWWAGGGVELGVFEESGQLVMKKGVLDEGGAETPGLRGNFEMLLRLMP